MLYSNQNIKHDKKLVKNINALHLDYEQNAQIFQL